MTTMAVTAVVKRVTWDWPLLDIKTPHAFGLCSHAAK